MEEARLIDRTICGGCIGQQLVRLSFAFSIYLYCDATDVSEDLLVVLEEKSVCVDGRTVDSIESS